MNSTKIVLAILTVGATTNLVLAKDDIPVTANVGVVSNYMWRGVTQSNNGAAVQGGLDYASDSGLSAGTWVSNVHPVDGSIIPGIKFPKYEWDLYAGYADKLGDFGYNLTTTYYAYPDGKDNNFWELGASGSFDPITIGVAYTVDGQAPKPAPFRSGDIYYYGSLSFDLPASFKLVGTLGHYDFKDLGSFNDYTNWELSLSKDVGTFGTISFNYDQNDGGKVSTVAADSDPKLWVGWKKTF